MTKHRAPVGGGAPTREEASPAAESVSLKSTLLAQAFNTAVYTAVLFPIAGGLSLGAYDDIAVVSRYVVVGRTGQVMNPEIRTVTYRR